MTKIAPQSDLVRPMLSRYFRVGLRTAQAQAQAQAQETSPSAPPATDGFDQVSLSPGLRKLEAGSAVLQKTVASLAHHGMLPQAPSALAPSHLSTPHPEELEAALLPTSDQAGDSLAEDVLARITGPAFDRFQAEHPAANAQELGEFRQQAVDALTRGFADARAHLDEIGGLDDDVQAHLDTAQNHALSRLDEFLGNVGQFSGFNPKP